MSKSNGEFLTLSLLESKGYNPLVYRLFCLQSHYRKPLLFTYDSLDIAANAYNKLKNKISSISNDNSIIDNEIIGKYRYSFKEALSYDLNTSNALTVLYDLLKDNETNNNTKLELIKEFDTVLSLDLLKDNTNEIDSELKSYIEGMITKRN